MARGALPDSHPQNLGMPGMHGTVPAVTALQKSDLLITLGARFDDRVTGDVKSFAREAKVIHIDIDPAEIGKIRFADVPIVGDLKEVLIELNAELEQRNKKPDLADWWKFIEGLRTRYPLVKPVRKGEYECDLGKDIAWPFTRIVRAEWSGRTWKDEEGKSVKGIVAWRGLAENPDKLAVSECECVQCDWVGPIDDTHDNDGEMRCPECGEPVELK
jgi:hypothetical protein